MDRLSRKELKTDKVAEGLAHSLDYVSGHKTEVKKYVAAVVAVLVIAGGYWIYSSRQAAGRTKALADAMHVADAVIGDQPQPPNMNFPTQLEKDTAVTEAYTNVANNYPGSQEGSIARLYLAAMAVDKGELDKAVTLHQETMDRAPDDYASVAKMALAEVYASQNKLADAEKLLRELMDDPTTFVSSEQAALTLGRILSREKPEEARKVLEPLRESRTAISRAAIDALGRLPAAPVTTSPTNN